MWQLLLAISSYIAKHFSTEVQRFPGPTLPGVRQDHADARQHFHPSPQCTKGTTLSTWEIVLPWQPFDMPLPWQPPNNIFLALGAQGINYPASSFCSDTLQNKTHFSCSQVVIHWEYVASSTDTSPWWGRTCEGTMRCLRNSRTGTGTRILSASQFRRQSYWMILNDFIESTAGTYSRTAESSRYLGQRAS